MQDSLPILMYCLIRSIEYEECKMRMLSHYRAYAKLYIIKTI